MLHLVESKPRNLMLVTVDFDGKERKSSRTFESIEEAFDYACSEWDDERESANIYDADTYDCVASVTYLGNVYLYDASGNEIELSR